MTDSGQSVGLRHALGHLLRAVDPRRKFQLALLTLLTVANGAADLAMVATAMVFLGALAGQLPSGLPSLLGDWFRVIPPGKAVVVAAILFGGSAALANLIRLLYLRLSETYVAEVTHELTMEVQRRVFAQPYEYHVRHHSSELLATLQTVPVAAHNLVHQWLQTAALTATGVAIAWLLIRFDPLPAIAGFAALSLFYLAVAWFAARQLNANSAIVGQSYSERIRKAQESIAAIRDVKIDHSERALLDEFRLADARYARATASTAFIVAAPRHIVEAGATVIIAGLAAFLSSRSSAGALVLIGGIALGGLRILPLLQQAYRSWALTIANRSIYGQVFELLSLPTPAEAENDVAPLPFRSEVRLEGIDFRYQERTQPVLSDITLTIGRGSRIGLAGETGAGKSTLIDLIMGLLPLQSGTLRIDGVEIGPAQIRPWQRNIAHVSQSVFMADASIARNIAFSLPGAGVDLDRVREAAEKAAIADFIETLPDGYETVIGERGIRLSGGQRQRIAIARALFKNTPFLILDEATNALDEETEARVLANIFADKDRTILIIAHRPSALQLCDRIVQLNQGRIVES